MRQLFYVIGAVLGMFILGLFMFKPNDQESTAIGTPIEQVQLESSQGPIDETTLHNRWTLLYLGYASCPDVCPMTLAQIAKIYPTLKAIFKEAPPQVIFVSVDPDRDQLARLTPYVQGFNGEFIAATASKVLLERLASNLGTSFKSLKKSDKENYEVIHPAGIFLINPEGELEAVLEQQAAASDIVAEIKQTIDMF